jgi:anti-sigma28 factor (negative regulator of flagellin synthesis)
MDIRSISRAYEPPAYEPAPKSDKKNENAKTLGVSKESVELSAASVNLQKIKEAVEKAPDIRIPMVEKIREKIKTNHYPVDLTLDTVLERLQKNRIL